MISLTPLILHLEPKPIWFEGIWFRKVAGASAYAKIRPESLPLPAAWVVRDADKSKSAGEAADNTTPGFDVVVAIENAREHQPGETDDLLLKYRSAIYRSLRGKVIVPDTRPISFHGGRVIEYTDGDLYWADRYSFEGLITNYEPDPNPFESLTNTGATL